MTEPTLDDLIDQVLAMGEGMPGSGEPKPATAPPGKAWYQDPDGNYVLGDAAPTYTVSNPSGRFALDLKGRRGPDTRQVGFESPRVGMEYFGKSPEEWGMFQAVAPFLTDAQTRAFLGLDSVLGGGGGGSGDALGWSSLAQRQAEFAYAQEQDKIAHAMNQISMYAAQQAREDALAQARQEATLAALPFMAPRGATHMPGFEPDAYGMRSGMLKPMPITRVAFDPNAVGAPAAMGDTIDAELAKIASMAGI